ncbi:MAG: NAD kinase [Prolixibacteraceae bacterium]|jgi:NAD+ kinase|nr:NAD kinase [Prolixibacteraceae bacterium]MBT6004235.1 NAD kinase [Prolixibacteraceae bacterium]MBT6766522.1 NAD kinase [Prolixibacteraceae bacterium]MBT6997904.1 NAD kinase [Prolixibacteraceae bacterium]MBT7395624.1 NAD kinase [Prolixibacteraceae bacterium]
MKIAVFGTSVSNDFIPVLEEFFQFLKTNEIEVQLFKPFYSFLVEDLKTKPYYTSFFHSFVDFDVNNEFIFSVGGDGTFLHSVLNIRNFEIPVVGVNSGRLGFLADISQDQVKDALTNIFNKNYSVIERSMLQVDFEGHRNIDFNFALNEITVQKTDTSSMINISAYYGKELLNNYWADGLIISTPTGSTAYSLSVGGPILTPDSENFVITPLAPHNLAIRPIVVPDDYEIKLKVEGRGPHYLTSLDFRSEAVEFSTIIKVRKAKFKLKTLQLPDQEFFNTLRNKLMWGIDKRN